MVTNCEIEMRWVDAWNTLHEIVGIQQDTLCMLPDHTVVDIEQCKGWIQKSAYEGFLIQVKSGWVGHRTGVIVSRHAPGTSPAG